jgi:hypothetical protein
MMLRPHLLAASFSVLGLCAQTAPTLAVDANANRHPISPYIYGINEWSDNGLLEIDAHSGAPLGRRRRHQLQLAEQRQEQHRRQPVVLRKLQRQSRFRCSFHEANLSAGTVSLGTIPLMDWSPKAAGECSFSVAKYGAQKGTARQSDCGNGILASNGRRSSERSQRRLRIPCTQTFAQQWVQQT